MSVAMIGPKFYAWDKNGKPLAFGKLYTYQARTNNPKDTYQSEDQIVANTNPVILNGEGYANVYLSGSYKMVLKDENENEIWTSDPVSSAEPSEWVLCLTATYLSPTSFKVNGNFTTQYEPGRRVRIDNNASVYSYSTINTSVFSSGETTVTITEPVITTGIVEVCRSIIGLESVEVTPSYLETVLSDYVAIKTKAEAVADTSAKAGDYVRISDRYYKLFQYQTGQTPNGDNIIAADADGVDLVAIVEKSISISSFGALTGVDSTSAIQAAFTLAATTNAEEVVLDAGSPIVSSTLTAGRFRIRGYGDASRLVPTISDGSAVIQFPEGTNFLDLKSFRIDSGINLTDFVDGTVDAQNCIGIQILSGGSNSARFSMEDVTVRGCKEGYDIDGFIGRLDNVWALACELGLKATQFNSIKALLRFEECRKDMEITNSSGIQFDNYLTEGGQQQSGLISSTIDGCSGVHFVQSYLEQSRNVPFITFGGTSECRGITMGNVYLASQENVANDYNVALLHFDDVNGLNILGDFSTGSHHNRYTTTANTKNIVDNTVSTSPDVFAPHDMSLSLSPTLNHFPNPTFDHWLGGWPAISAARCTIAKETALVRTGMNAIKMTFDIAETAAASISFVMNEADLTPANLQGKTISLYAWVYIPDTDDFNANDLTAQRIQPSISIFTDGTGGTTTASGSHNTMRGQWNLFKVAASVPIDCTRIDTKINMALNSGTTDGDEEIIIDSMYIVEGDLSKTCHIANGNVRDSGYNPAIIQGGRLMQVVTSLPSDADLVFNKGDQFLLKEVNAGSSLGWIVTTAGTGATMTTKTLPSISS